MTILDRVLALEVAMAKQAEIVASIKTADAEIEALKATQKDAIATGDAAVLAAVKAQIEEKSSAMSELVKRMDQLEKLDGRKGLLGGDEGWKGAVEQLVESDAYKAFAKSSSAKKMDGVKIKRPARSLARKGIFDSGSTGSAPFATERMMDAVIPPVEPPVLMMLLPSIDLGADGSLKYPEVTQILYLHTTLAANVLIDATTLTLTNASGVKVGSTLRIDNNANKTAVVQSVDLATNIVTLTGETGWTASSGQDVDSDKFTFTNESVDGAIRYAPEMKTVTTEETATTKTITVTHPASRQSLVKAPVCELILRSFIERALNDAIDHNGFYGSGSGPEFQGIMTHASAQTYAWSDGVAGDLKMDAVRRAATLCRLSKYKPNAVILHPLDLEDIELSKDDEGRYILINVAVGVGLTVMWRLAVYESAQIDQGDFLVADFTQLGFFFTQGSMEIAIGDQDGTNFGAHLLTLRGHEDIGMVIWNPAAAVVGEFDAAPVA